MATIDIVKLMKPRTLLTLAFVLSAASVGAQEKPQASPSPGVPVFPAQLDVVTVDAVVTQKGEKGDKPVTDLTQADFTITEDGTAQTITSFERVSVPDAAPSGPSTLSRVSVNETPAHQASRTFVVVFDDVHLTPFQARRAKGAVATFLTEGVREGDRVLLVATGGGAWWSTKMMGGKDALISLLKRLDGRYIPDTSPERITDSEAMRIHVYRDQQVIERVQRRFETYGVSPLGRNNSARGIGADGDPQVLGRASEVYYQSVTRNRISLSVIQRVLDSLVGSRGRKSLILVGQGFIYDPQLNEFKTVVQSSRRSNCAIYFLDTEGLGGLSTYQTAEFGPSMDTQDLGAAFTENLERAEGAESISADSGGFSVKNTNDLTKGIQRIVDDSRSYYLIGYQPTNAARDGKFRKISVKVGRKGTKVRARKGYYAPLEGQAAQPRKPGDSDPDIQSALDSPYESDAIPMRMTHVVGEEALLGKAAVSVVTEVDIRNLGFTEKEGRFVDTLEFLLIVAHRETGEFFRYDQKVDMKLLPETRKKIDKQWFPIARDFELAPGGYQAKIVVRDKNSGIVGTVIHEFEVPELGTFRISTPVIGDTLQPQPAAEKDKQSPPRAALTGRRAFPSGEQRYLFCQFEVFGAQKDKQSGMPTVSAGYVVQKSDGTVATKVEPTPIKPTSIGKLSRFSATSLQGYAPGDYKLVLSLKDELSGKTVEYAEPFTVTAPETGAPSSK